MLGKQQTEAIIAELVAKCYDPKTQRYSKPGLVKVLKEQFNYWLGEEFHFFKLQFPS